MKAASPGHWREVFSAFLRLGLTSFGRPSLVVRLCAGPAAEFAVTVS